RRPWQSLVTREFESKSAARRVPSGASAFCGNPLRHLCVNHLPYSPFANTARPILGKRSRQENCCTRRVRERIIALISFARMCVVSRGMPVLFRETIRPVTCLKQQARKIGCRQVYEVYE